jgi:AcrR family transcriptional regulator
MVMNAVATTVTRRRTPRAELRRRIEAAAMDLWRDQGFDAVSVDTIVGRAGVSKGAFFIFFKTKAEALGVYAEVLSERMQAVRGLLDPSRPLSSLDAFAAAAERVLDGEGDLGRTLYRELGARAFTELRRDDVEAFTAFIEQAQACGGLDPDMDPAVAGDLVCDLWTSGLLDWAANGGGLAERMRPRFRLLVCGLGA